MSYLDILVDIDGILTFKLFDKRDYFNFPIVNLPHLDSNIPVKPAYGVYISQLIRYFRACTYYSDFLYSYQLLVQKLVLLQKVLKHSLFKFCCINNVEGTYNKTQNIIVKQGIYHNSVNYTTLPNSSMTNDLPVCSSVITSMSPVVCTPVSLGAYTPMSSGVSAPVLSSVIKPESPCVPVPVSPGESSPHLSAMWCGSSYHHNHILIQQSHVTTSVSQVSDGVDWKPIGLQNLGNTCYLNSVLQCLFTIDYYTSFLPVNTASTLIKILKEFTENKKESKDVRDIRTLLISNERDSILSNAEQNTGDSEVQGIFHTNRQQDAHESLLIILDILHNHTKIDLFPGLALKYSSIIRNTFHGIINSTHTCTACKWVTTTSSNFCELQITLESDIGTGISV